MSSTNGTTMTQTFDCTVTVTGPGRKLWTVISPGGTKTIPLNLDVIDNVAINDDEEAIIRKIKVWGGMNVKFPYTFTRDELVILNELYKRTTNMPAPVPALPPVEIHPPVVQTPAPVIAPPVPTLSSLEHHTVTVTQPAAPTENEGAKKRKKRGEKMGNWLNEEYRKRTRGWGIDKMEEQINRLQKVVELANQEVSIVVYDIPTDIREMIVDPCNIFHCVGFRYNKSVWIVPTKVLTYGIMERLFEMWDNFTEETRVNDPERYNNAAGNLPLINGKRQVIEYGIEEFSAKSMERLRAMAEKDLRTVLIDAHGSMIRAIDKADKDLEEALKDEKLTSKDIEKEHCGRANDIRAALVKAGEILRRSVVKALEYDNTEKVMDLLSALRDAILSQATTFNAEQRMKRAEGVEV